MKARFYFSLSLLIMLAAYGCGGSSEMERKKAQEAMEKARKLHADDFAPTDFQKAQVALDHAQAAEKEGKTDGAKVLFTSAKIFFGKAADIAKARQDALSRELDSMRSMIASNFDQVKIDLSVSTLPPRQKSQAEALVSEADKGNAEIIRLVAEEDLSKAVLTAKDVQTKIYHAQLILAGRKIK